MLTAKSIERLVALADQLDQQEHRDIAEVIDNVLDMANTAVVELTDLAETQSQTLSEESVHPAPAGE